MPEKFRSAPNDGKQPTAKPPRNYSEPRRFVRSAVPFMLIGFVLYAGLYVAAELLIARYALRNPFYMVKTAPRANYDYVILGASHATVFDNRDMNARLEEMTGSKILNLSTVGGGITLNRLLLEYFLAAHRTKSVVYVLDSFLFYSRKWNEERLQDARLFLRAPWDPELASQLLSTPAARFVALDYIVGLSRINNPDRFVPDVRDTEDARFDRVYRPVEQIDRQRIAYLYPEEIDETSLPDSPYLAEFEKLIQDLQSRGIRFIVLRPPIPERIYRIIPNERQFDATLKAVLERHEVDLHDFSAVNNDEQFFFDSDHLNHAGVLSFFENYLQHVLTPDEAKR